MFGLFIFILLIVGSYFVIPLIKSNHELIWLTGFQIMLGVVGWLLLKQWDALAVFG